LDQIAAVNASASEEISASVTELSRIAESTRNEMQAFRC
jgi:methyl-accepting chemotaxis protein